MARLLPTMAALILALVATGPTRADDPAPTRHRVGDRAINEIAQQAIDTGYRLYNRRDHVGSYRVYQNALRSIMPRLSDRPDLMRTVESALKDSDRLPDVTARAFALRKTLDTVYQSTIGPKSLWDRLGGERAVAAVVHDFVATAASDPKVDFTRGGEHKLDAAGVVRLERRLVELLSTVTGGPLKYSGRDMKQLHQGMEITEAQFDAMAADLFLVLDKHRIPATERDELAAILGATKPAFVEGARSRPAEIADAAPTPMPEKPKEAPLWDRLGGEEAIKLIVHDLVEKAAADPQVNFLRDGKYKLDEAAVGHLETAILEFLSSATGGPLKYSGKPMKAAHEGMKITGEQFDAMTADLAEILKEYKVAQKEANELMGLVGATKKDIVEAK